MGGRIATRCCGSAALITISLLLTGTAPGQWIDFKDLTADRLVIAAGDDQMEKDCAVGDFDRDGWDDIVVVRKLPFKTVGGAADLLLMNREGILHDETASLAPEFLTHLTDARDVFVTDLDQDGWPDLILANTFGEQPTCYMNRGDGGTVGNWRGFAEDPSRLPRLDIPAVQFCAVCAADITGDGAPELYFSNYVRAPDIALDVLLLNDGSGHFSDVSDSRLGLLRQSAFGTSVDIRDLDGDGDLDIVKTSSLNSVPPWNEVGIFILFNDGTGHYSEFQAVPTESPYMFAVDDLNNDGRLDLYIVNDSQDYTVLNAGFDAALPDPIIFDKSVLTSPRTTFLGGNLRCVDLDNDGDLDVAIADVDIDIGICETDPGDPRKFALLQNAGDASGNLIDPWGTESNVWNTNVFDLAVIDLNRDGKLDLVLCGCLGYLVLIQEHTLGVSPPAALFADTIAGASEERVLRFCNNGPTPIEISDIAVLGANFSCNTSTMSLAPFGCGAVTITFAPPAPGHHAATLRLTGDFPMEITLDGSSVTPPEAVLDTTPIDVQLAAGNSLSNSIALTNTGGSDLHLQIRITIPDSTPDPVLLLADTSASPLLLDILDGLPNHSDSADIDSISAASLDGFDTILLALVASPVSATTMSLLTDAIRDGKTLIVLGASTSPEFLEGLQGHLLDFVDRPGWKQPGDPHFSISDTNHPLADGLPATHQFNSASASWFRIEPDDATAWVAATNGDGVPCLLSKPVGAGSLIYFTNWPLSVAWDNPIDRPILEQVLANSIGFAQSAWLSVSPRSLTIPAGGSVDLNLNFNTLGQSPGSHRVELVLTSDDPTRPEIVIPVTLQITSPDTRTILEVDAVIDGSITLTLHGPPGSTYQIQRSKDLIHWESIREITPNTPSPQITDSPPPPASRFFYRASTLVEE